MTWRRYRSLLVVLGISLASCTTIGPTVDVSPAPGKSPEAFVEDRRGCMASTDAALQLSATRMNLSASSTGDIVAGNARIQVMYDDRFGQCMSARGNIVTASATAARQIQVPDAADGATIGVRQDADPASADAERALAPMISRLRHDCDGEDIVAHAKDVIVSARSTARVVALTEPHGGNCFGEPGENDYLVQRQGGRWSLLLAAEPGSISVLPVSSSRPADVELHSLGMCVYRYGWTSGGYAIAGSHECTLPAPPNIGTLPGLLR